MLSLKALAEAGIGAGCTRSITLLNGTKETGSVLISAFLAPGPTDSSPPGPVVRGVTDFNECVLLIKHIKTKDLKPVELMSKFGDKNDPFVELSLVDDNAKSAKDKKKSWSARTTTAWEGGGDVDWECDGSDPKWSLSTSQTELRAKKMKVKVYDDNQAAFPSNNDNNRSFNCSLLLFFPSLLSFDVCSIYWRIRISSDKPG